MAKHICRAALCCMCMLGIRAYAAEDDGIFADATAKVHTAISEDSDITANLIVGSGFEVLDTQTDDNGNTWYRIKTDFGAEGYVKSEALEKVTIEMPENSGNTIENNADNDILPGQLGELNVLETINLRRQPSTASEIIVKIERDTKLPYFDEYVNELGEVWYQVSYENIMGYVTDSAVAIVQQVPLDENMQLDEGEQFEEGEHPEEDGQPNEGEQSPDEDNFDETALTMTNENPEQNQTQDNAQAVDKGAAAKADTDIATSSEPVTDINALSISEGKKHHIKLDLLTIACILGDILGVAMLALLLKKIYKLIRISKTGKKVKRQEKRNNVYR